MSLAGQTADICLNNPRPRPAVAICAGDIECRGHAQEAPAAGSGGSTGPGSLWKAIAPIDIARFGPGWRSRLIRIRSQGRNRAFGTNHFACQGDLSLARWPPKIRYSFGHDSCPSWPSVSLVQMRGDLSMLSPMTKLLRSASARGLDASHAATPAGCRRSSSSSSSRRISSSRIRADQEPASCSAGKLARHNEQSSASSCKPTPIRTQVVLASLECSDVSGRSRLLRISSRRIASSAMSTDCPNAPGGYWAEDGEPASAIARRSCRATTEMIALAVTTRVFRTVASPYATFANRHEASLHEAQT